MLALSFLSLNPRFYKLVGTTYCLLGFLLKPKGIYLSQKKKKRLKNRIKQYRYKLESGEWDEAEYALHITPIFAHVAISRCRKYCNRILQG